MLDQLALAQQPVHQRPHLRQAHKDQSKGNDLLFLFPQQAKDRVFPLIREIELPMGREIHAAGQKANFVYFPTDCIISYIYVTYDGHSTEVSAVGREGVAGIEVFMGTASSPCRAIVASAGTACRLSATDFKREFENDAVIRSLMLLYTQTLITQVTQNAVCNRHHTIDQRLCRWLLLSLDRLPTNKLIMTQELIATMLGVRRESVTEAAGKLQKLGVIQYQRGSITVLDRPRLEALSCECYAIVKGETDRLVA